jgi:hypothetical protein
MSGLQWPTVNSAVISPPIDSFYIIKGQYFDPPLDSGNWVDQSLNTNGYYSFSTTTLKVVGPDNGSRGLWFYSNMC